MTDARTTGAQPPEGTPSTSEASAESSRIARVNRILILVVFGILAAFLSFIIGALYFGIINPPAPRTALERSIKVYGDAIEKGTDDPKVWADYISTLVQAKQFTRAAGAVTDALAVVEKDRSLIMAQAARMYYEDGDFEKAVAESDVALKEVEVEYDVVVEDYKSRGIVATPRRSEAYESTLLTKARALVELGKAEDAVEVFDKYLLVVPTATDVLVLRGDAKIDAGDKAGAESDYREALKFVSDFEPALEGLRSIGAEAK